MLFGPTNWRTCQRLTDHFWQRWLKEYLRILVPRQARGDPTYFAPAKGDVVLIVNPSSPRYSWSLGKIEKTYLPGSWQSSPCDGRQDDWRRSAASYFEDLRAGVIRSGGCSVS
ncbi:hypothetical protein EVAR_42102_1 [Eumeta japonica]|uniref:DUF5641 domain-containing protein n=1 Tax=Eumeta variegata TaxID=151549 RepID=A0A4C1XG07_EUMVA|nr:hypothetical protein EVAR_42102_1 [Eumeta japonica]